MADFFLFFLSSFINRLGQYGSWNSKSRRASKLHDRFKSYKNFNNVFHPWLIRFFLDLEPVYCGWWPLVGISDKWKVTCDMWHMTCDMWLVTHDTWFCLKVPEKSQRMPKMPKIAKKCPKVQKSLFILMVEEKFIWTKI